MRIRHYLIRCDLTPRALNLYVVYINHNENIGKSAKWNPFSLTFLAAYCRLREDTFGVAEHSVMDRRMNSLIMIMDGLPEKAIVAKSSRLSRQWAL